jgi:hypothetical protein
MILLNRFGGVELLTNFLMMVGDFNLVSLFSIIYHLIPTRRQVVLDDRVPWAP